VNRPADDPSAGSRSHIALLILGLIAEEPMYGYRIIKELSARSERHFQMKEGSLYPVLHQLEKDGLLTTEWQEQRGKPSRRYYHLTSKGRKELARAKGQFNAHVRAMRSVLEPGS
jgi:PadR family transcriptional regulator PadR